MALTFGEFKSQIRFLTRENPANPAQLKYATSANLLLAWNRVTSHINKITRSKEVSNVETPIVSVSAQRLYAYPTGTGIKTNRIHAMYFDGRPVEYATTWDLSKSSGSGMPWFLYQGTFPRKWYMDGDKFGFWPLCMINGKNIIMFGVRDIDPPASSSDDAALSQMDDSLSMAVIWFGCQYILHSRREFAWAKEFEAQWRQSIEADYGPIQIDRNAIGDTPFLMNDPLEEF